MSHNRLLALGASLLIGAAAITTATPALAASNLTFMQDSPLAFMRAKDNASIARAAGAVLSDKADNETVDWNNKGTGNSTAITGTLTATNTQKNGDATCRDLIVLLTARAQDVTLRLTACKANDSAPWKLQKRASP